MAFIPAYVLILFLIILIDYFAAKLIARNAGNGRKMYLLISVVANVGLLVFFKYYGFLASNIQQLAGFLHWNYSLSIFSFILPIGLSFHTFQAMSYTIEVYRGRQEPERHLGIYALYVLFYPQLVAGPIERPQNLIHQFYENHKFEYIRVTNGLKLMAWGLFKKMVIADRAAAFVDAVYNNIPAYHGISFVIATILFSFQIYCDFSGYSDIAIGAAQVLGFKLMNNFDRPYFSKSISEFWKRWHISLSSWFRDYLYIPLGGNRVSKTRWYFNLFFVFLISGLWHGANWTFIIWGSLHGFYLIFALWTKQIREKIVKQMGFYKFPYIYKIFKVFTIFVLVSFAWIFFRAKNIEEAIFVIKNMSKGILDVFRNFSNLSFIQNDVLLGQTYLRAIVLIGAIIFMESFHLIQRRGDPRHILNLKPVYYRWGVYVVLFWSIVFLGQFGAKQFIYFVF